MKLRRIDNAKRRPPVDLDQSRTGNSAAGSSHVLGNRFTNTRRHDGRHRDRATACSSKRDARRPAFGAEQVRCLSHHCPDQQYLPLLFHYALSFYDVASRPNTSLKSLEAFLAHPYSYETMPSPDLTPAQATDLAAYILSLGAGIDYSRQIGCGRHSGQERRVTPPAPHRIRQFWSH